MQLYHFPWILWEDFEDFRCIIWLPDVPRLHFATWESVDWSIARIIGFIAFALSTNNLAKL